MLATVGNRVITTADFEARMNEQSPFIRARYDTLERKREFLDDMVRFELLAQEAERRGLRDDPDVVSAMKKVMVQKLMRTEFDDPAAGADFPEAELRAFYQEHIDDYVKPERVRVSHVFLEAKDPADRAKVRSEASRLLVDVKAKEAGPNKTAFAEAARSRSDDASSKLAGGDLLFKTRQELTEAWGETFANAAFGLQEIGQIGSLVETDRGFHLIKLTGRQNALDRPFEAVESQIRNRLFREQRTKRFEAFVEELKTKANVQVKEDVLASLQVAPQQNPAAPVPAIAPAKKDDGGAVPAKAGGEAKEATPARGGDAQGAAGKQNGPVELTGPAGRKVTVPAAVIEHAKKAPKLEADRKPAQK